MKLLDEYFESIKDDLSKAGCSCYFSACFFSRRCSLHLCAHLSILDIVHHCSSLQPPHLWSLAFYSITFKVVCNRLYAASCVQPIKFFFSLCLVTECHCLNRETKSSLTVLAWKAGFQRIMCLFESAFVVAFSSLVKCIFRNLFSFTFYITTCIPYKQSFDDGIQHGAIM